MSVYSTVISGNGTPFSFARLHQSLQHTGHSVSFIANHRWLYHVCGVITDVTLADACMHIHHARLDVVPAVRPTQWRLPNDSLALNAYVTVLPACLNWQCAQRRPATIMQHRLRGSATCSNAFKPIVEWMTLQACKYIEITCYHQ